MHGATRVIRNAPYPLYRRDSGTALDLSKDGGAEAAATNTPVETPAASGIYYNLLTATEMAADIIGYLGSAGSIQSDGFLHTEPAIDSGVAQAGASGTITLRASAPAFTLVGFQVEIVRGTGKDQKPRLITGYNTGTKVADVYPAWGTNPDNTSVYIVTPIAAADVTSVYGYNFPAEFMADLYRFGVKEGTVQTGSTTSIIKTNLTGLSTNPVGCAFFARGATNQGFMKSIIGYDTSTGDFEVAPAFASAPANGEEFWVFGLVG